MPQIPFRANLQSLAFPLLSSLSGRTVIDQGSDQTYYPQVSTDGGVPIDRGVPQAFYAHNVMPSTYGWQSIGYKDAFLPPLDGAAGFTEAFLVRGAELELVEPNEEDEESEEEEDEDPEQIVVPQDKRTYLAIAKLGEEYFLYKVIEGVNPWSRVANGVPELASNTYITTAELNGVTYIYLSRIGCFIYNVTTDTLIERELTGLDVVDQLGIVGSNGYMLVYNEVSIAWSSAVDVEDFEPSDISGAGGGSVQEAAGQIVTAVPTFLGFILYTQGNAVSVTYSGNESFPWIFKAIPSSGGLDHRGMVSLKDSNGYQFAYTTNGIQKLSHQKAETVFPSITDFLSGGTFEDYNTSTGEFIEDQLIYPMKKRVALISDRYLILSYGRYTTEGCTHAIIVDISQSRYGKLKYFHEQVFERFNIDPGHTEVAKESICCLSGNGHCQVVDFSVDAPANGDSVVILGKYQVARQAFTQVQELEIENIKYGDTCLVYGLPSLDGKQLSAGSGRVSGFEVKTSGSLSRRYLFPSLVGKSVSFVIQGKFNIISFILWFTLNGRF